MDTGTAGGTRGWELHGVSLAARNARGVRDTLVKAYDVKLARRVGSGCFYHHEDCGTQQRYGFSAVCAPVARVVGDGIRTVGRDE